MSPRVDIIASGIRGDHVNPEEMMDKRNWRLTAALCAPMFALLASDLENPARAEKPPPAHPIPTTTPIKHVIIIVGENRSFDHLFATYVPRHRNERVQNLLSEGIVNADGSPGRNFAKARQYEVASAPNG